jgi:hypothetical protein
VPHWRSPLHGDHEIGVTGGSVVVVVEGGVVDVVGA